MANQNAIADLDTTPANNLNFRGQSMQGSAPVSTIDNMFQKQSAMLAALYDSLGGAATAAGTTALTVTITDDWTAYAHGLILAIKVPNAATGATTLVPTVPTAGALASKKIRRQGDTAIQANDWLANATILLKYDSAYDSAAGAWVLLNIASVCRVVTQVFTGSGTYTPTANMLYCIIECVGGGGGSGGLPSATSGQGWAGGAGGGGSYSWIVASAATIGASKTVTVGAAGSAGVSGASTGGTGGATSVGTICTTNGGAGGVGNVSGGGAGGVGGAAGTGDIAIAGSAGGNGLANGIITVYVIAPGGGSNPMGIGAPNTAGISSFAGTGGSGYGWGAGGAISYNASGATAGRAGGSGIVIITEFCSS